MNSLNFSLAPAGERASLLLLLLVVASCGALTPPRPDGGTGGGGTQTGGGTEAPWLEVTLQVPPGTTGTVQRLSARPGEIYALIANQ